METESKMISVCIPTYCSYDLLKRALKSVLIQNFEDLEIIIIDDHSEDGSWKKTKCLYKKDKRIKVIRNKENLGLSNWNKCIQLSKGKYILILHHDDELLPGMIQRTVNFLENNPLVGLVHTNGYDCTSDGRMSLRKTQDKKILKAGHEALVKCLTNHNFICSSVVIPRKYGGKGFIENSPSPDAEMYARIAKNHDLGHISTPLVRCYIRDESAGSEILLNESAELLESKWLDLSEIIISYFPKQEQKEIRPLINQPLANSLWAAGSIALRNGNWKRGKIFFNKASKYVSKREIVNLYIHTIFSVCYHRYFIKNLKKR